MKQLNLASLGVLSIAATTLSTPAQADDLTLCLSLIHI